MDIYYEKPVEMHYELDLDALVSIIIEDFEEEPNESIIYHWGDNQNYFLEKVGFKDWDYLDTYRIDLIYDAVCDKLEQLYD